MDFNRIILYISLLNEDITKLTAKKFKEIGIQDIKPSHAPIIAAIFNHGGKIQIGHLTKRLKRSKSTITSMVNRLESLGYIKRTYSNDDKRVIYLAATEKTEEFFTDFDRAIKDIVKQKFADFTLEDKQNLYSLIERTFDDDDDMSSTLPQVK
jgi:DNA-binding MarR family transcriptional regulator